jgi:hypothetical protein
MNTKLLAAALVLLGAGVVHAEDPHANCPMMSAKAKHDDVDRRHDQATGVPHAHATHHFLITPAGGTIRLETAAAGDDAGRDRIREHLQVITKAFAAGDFAIPMFVHDEVPPGVEAMKRKKAAIAYAFSPTDKGGEVRITTKDADALTAVHAFLRFQIEDHGTGDPTE